LSSDDNAGDTMTLDQPQPELVEDVPYLTHFGLRINTKLGLLCCKMCLDAVLSGNVSGHMAEKHKDLHQKVKAAKIRKIVEDYHLDDTFSKIPNYSHPPYAGLKVVKGFHCKHCGLNSISQEYLSKHHNKKHSDKPINISPATLQHYHGGQGGHVYWACQEPVTVHPTLSVEANNFMREIKQSLSGLGIPEVDRVDARQVDPWLLATNWHQLIQGYDKALLKSWVDNANKDNWESLLKKWVLDYTKRSLAAKMHTMELQMLNTPDPTDK
jgi:hypothetical protein